jgi:hypothetical protein
MFKPLLAITCLAVSNFAIASNGKWGVFVGTTAETVSGKKQQSITEIFIPVIQTEDNMTFIDLRGQLSKGDKGAISLGFGHRRKLNDTVAIGANASYDSSKTQSGNKANQAALGLELFVKKTSLKVNFSRPVGTSSNQVGDLVNYAHLDGDKIKISKSAIYEATMGGYSLELGHSFVLANGVTLSGNVTYYNYSKDGHESYTGTRATISATKAMDFWGLDGTFGGYVGLEDNNRNGTDVIAGVSAKFYLGKKGKRNSSKFSYLDRQMGSGISRRSTSVTGTKYENYSVDAATEIYGREFSYIKQLDAEDNIAAEVSSVDNNGKIILLKGSKGAIQITENVNIADNNVVIGKGRAFVVTGPNGEQATLILDEDAATIATSNQSRIGLGNNSILADMNIENASIHADGKNNIKVVNVDMLRENMESQYSTITFTNASNITLDNVKVEDHADDVDVDHGVDGVYALAVNFSENLNIINSNIFSENSNAIYSKNTKDITITGSEFTSLKDYNIHDYTRAALRFDFDDEEGGFLEFHGNTVNGAFSLADFTLVNITGNNFNSPEIDIDNDDDDIEYYSVLNFNNNIINYADPAYDHHDNDEHYQAHLHGSANVYIGSTDEVNMSGNTITDMRRMEIEDNGVVNYSGNEVVFTGNVEDEVRSRDSRRYRPRVIVADNEEVNMTADETGKRNEITGYNVDISDNSVSTVTDTDFASNAEDSREIIIDGESDEHNINFNNNTITNGTFEVTDMNQVNMSGNVMTGLTLYNVADNSNVVIDGDVVEAGYYYTTGNESLSQSNATITVTEDNGTQVNFNDEVVLFKNIFNTSQINLTENLALDIRENTVNSSGQVGFDIHRTYGDENIVANNTVVMTNDSGEMYGISVRSSDGLDITNNSVVYTKDQSGNTQAVGLYLGNSAMIFVSGLKVQDANIDIQINYGSSIDIFNSESNNTLGTSKNEFLINVLGSLEGSNIIDTFHKNRIDPTQKVKVVFEANDDTSNIQIVQSVEGKDSITLTCEGAAGAHFNISDIADGVFINRCH